MYQEHTIKSPLLNRFTSSAGTGLTGTSVNQSSSSLKGISGIYLTNTSSNPYIESSTSAYSAIIKGSNYHPSTRRLTQIPPSVLPLVSGDSNKATQVYGRKQFNKQRSDERIPQFVNADLNKAAVH